MGRFSICCVVMTPCTVACSVFTWTPVACNLDRGGRRAHVQRDVAIGGVVHLHGQVGLGGGETRRLDAHGVFTRESRGRSYKALPSSPSSSTAAQWICTHELNQGARRGTYCYSKSFTTITQKRRSRQSSCRRQPPASAPASCSRAIARGNQDVVLKMNMPVKVVLERMPPI